VPAIDLPNGTHMHYEIAGEGPVLLALAPGGLHSRSELWEYREDGRPRGIVSPVAALAHRHTVLTLDQRNAGRSTAPISEFDGWQAYAEDHLLLLDALGIERCHIIGACIGPSFALKIIELAPQRVLSAVLQQPIGKSDDNLQLRRQSFNSWSEKLLAQGRQLDTRVMAAIERNLFGSDFVYSVSRDFVRACATPLLVLPGNDARHPKAIGEEIAALAPNASLFSDWDSAAGQTHYAETLQTFFDSHNEPVGQP
jgi:hypothetical protein